MQVQAVQVELQGVQEMPTQGKRDHLGIWAFDGKDGQGKGRSRSMASKGWRCGAMEGGPCRCGGQMGM